VAGSLFIVVIVPNILAGAAGGRHQIIPSIGFIIFLYWLLEKVGHHWRKVYMPLVAAALIICQGNAWTQVVACRINGAVYETLKEKKMDLLSAQNIIIDIRSFADEIPFTLVQRDFNVLNTYYGAQTFETWGLRAMVQLAAEQPDKLAPVYIATESPKNLSDGSMQISISNLAGYRSVNKEVRKIPAKNTVIIDYRAVYGDGFNNGKRRSLHDGS
jgi:hypothetical protein